MARKFVFVGVLYLASVAAAGVLENRNNEETKAKEPEKKPNIVRDYVCLRDGELCHPQHNHNRGLYVSCSNGVAWEQTCPRCSYHPINCPTRTLWFDGEKCEWASPKLASMPCVDKFPQINFHQKEGEENIPSEQEAIHGPSYSEANAAGPTYFKSPKLGDEDLNKESAVKEEKVEANVVSQEKEVAVPAKEDDHKGKVDSSNNKIKRKHLKLAEEEDSDVSAFRSDDDLFGGGRIIRLNEPVYTLVKNPDGSGQQVLMRISQPFVLEDSARAILPSLNIINSSSGKE